jgi:hypothetical protein
MPADYVIITSSPFIFNYPGSGEMDKSLEFILPAGAKVDSNSILFWSAELYIPTGVSLNWRININTKEVYNRYSSSGTTHASFHTVIGANILKEAGNTNNIEFEIQGTGTSYSNLKFSDVYLMIQV